MTGTTTLERDIQVYLLAAPEDQNICEELTKHLKPIIRSSPLPIEIDSDFDIPSGANIEEYKERLFEADIVLALISVDFIDNDEIYHRNQKVIERHNKNQTVMIPILVRNCLWRATPFSSLPVVPKNQQPLNNKKFWNSQDDAVMAVVNDIYASINELTEIQSEASQPTPESAVETSVSLTDAPATAEELAHVQSEVKQASPAPAPSQEASPVAETKSVPDAKPAPKISISHTTNSSPMTVDWRKKYYFKVALKRAGAIIFDHLFVFVLTIILLLPFDTASDETFGNVLLIVSFGLYYVLMPLMETSKWQGTIGKRILKLQITDKEGERISFFRAVWRNIMRSIVLYLYIISFGALLIVQYFRFDKTKKLFHDELSGTVIGERLPTSAGQTPVVANPA